MTPKQIDMLLRADGASLPGDGLRLVGPGAHRVAANLQAMGYVRVARPIHEKARAHITEAGRVALRKIAIATMLSPALADVAAILARQAFQLACTRLATEAEQQATSVDDDALWPDRPSSAHLVRTYLRDLAHELRAKAEGPRG